MFLIKLVYYFLSLMTFYSFMYVDENAPNNKRNILNIIVHFLWLSDQ